MEKPLEIVHGGGWVVWLTVGRPKTRLFLLLSASWLVVSVPALFPFLDGWPQSFEEVEVLASVLMAPHPVFVILAVFFSCTERPRIMEQHVPNPDCDPKKLY
jgi:hypothetical protein